MSCVDVVHINGHPQPLPRGQSAAGLLADLGLARPGVMVAVNGAAVPAGELAGCTLHSGDHVEIVQATAGG